MKGLYVLLSFALLAIPVHAQGISSSEEPIDLEALYQQIDDAISLSPQYVAERERQISVCRDSFLMECAKRHQCRTVILGTILP